MARPETLPAGEVRAEVGEGAFWDAEESALFWVDIPKGNLHRLDPGSGAERTWNVGEPIGCAALRRQGGAIVALKSGFHALDLASGARRFLLDPEADQPQNRFNDGTVDTMGRIWAGTMATGRVARTGRFWRLDPDLSCTAHFEPMLTTNGLAFAPDGRSMYFSDSNPEVRTIWACDYDPSTGTPSNRRVFFDTRAVAGRPDGGTVDADGCYWMAGVGGWQLVRLTPEGAIDRIVDLPVERPSRPAFGGKGMDTLFVTSIGVGLTPGSEARQPWAGRLLAIGGLGVQGVAQPRFAG